MYIQCWVRESWRNANQVVLTAVVVGTWLSGMRTEVDTAAIGKVVTAHCVGYSKAPTHASICTAMAACCQQIVKLELYLSFNWHSVVS